MTPKDTKKTATPASLGGQARRDALTAEQRSASARKAARARWGKRDLAGVPKATHGGMLKIGGMEMDCAVLEDGKRVLSQRGLARGLGASTPGSRNDDELPGFLSAKNLKPFISEGLATTLKAAVIYQTLGVGRQRGGGARALGFDAVLIPEICDVWLSAREAGALHYTQKHIAKQAEVLMRGLARVGIVALVDDATGYTAERDRSELNLILQAYINAELLPWTKRFPDDFYREMFRLWGWPYSPPQARKPQYVGILTRKLVYEQLPPGVVEELEKRNPTNKRGRRRHKHHQLLTEGIGDSHLEKQVAVVTALMRASNSKEAFLRSFHRVFPDGSGEQQLLLPETDDE